jgi:hypothetical protein
MIQRRKMKRTRKIVVILALFCVLSGWSQSKSLQDDLKISLKETRIRDFSMDGLTYVFYISIYNSSSSAYSLSGYEYRFVVNQLQYFHLQIPLLLSDKNHLCSSFSARRRDRARAPG